MFDDLEIFLEKRSQRVLRDGHGRAEIMGDKEISVKNNSAYPDRSIFDDSDGEDMDNKEEGKDKDKDHSSLKERQEGGEDAQMDTEPMPTQLPQPVQTPSSPNPSPSKLVPSANIEGMDSVHTQRKEFVFYHYPQYKSQYQMISTLLELLAGNLLTSTKSIKETFGDIVSLGLQLPHPNTGLFDDYLDSLTSMQLEEFTHRLLPRLARCALDAGNYFSAEASVHVLCRGDDEITLSRQHVLSLLSLSLFGLIPPENIKNTNRHPLIVNLFYRSRFHQDTNTIKMQKIKFILEYFIQTLKEDTEDLLTEYITYMRVSSASALGEDGCWQGECRGMGGVDIDSTGKIEDAMDTLRVDFANKYIGGGTLHSGAVQEEILFLITPECIGAMLLCEKLGERDALWIVGTRQYSEYSGYGDTLRYIGPHIPLVSAMDGRSRLATVIVCIDALKYTEDNRLDQYSPDNILRDTVKAYTGFSAKSPHLSLYEQWPVSSGKWGCGVFNGDKTLKFIIQWISASRAGRRMIFHTLMDYEYRQINRIISSLQHRSIGEVYSLLIGYAQAKSKHNIKTDIVEYILNDN